MTTLEQVTQMRSQGIDDNQIVENLQQQGVSPKEITDAINQANIKSAVAGNPGNPGEAAPAPEAAAGAAGTAAYAPSTQEAAAEAGYGGYDAGYAPEAGGAGGYADSGTMVEIANQVFSDKSKKIQDQVDDLNEFKTMTQTKVDSVDERLKKIEKMIDTLQIKILEKVGSYGKELEATKKEVSMVEETLGKVTKGMASKKSKKPAAKAKKTSKKK